MGWFNRFFGRAEPSLGVAPFSPAQLKQRLKNLGLGAPSVDVSARLDASALPTAVPSYDGGPLPEIDWIVDIEPGALVRSEAIRAASDQVRFESLGYAALFARGVRSGWQRYDGSLAPDEEFDALSFACRLLTIEEQISRSPSPEQLGKLLADSETFAKRLGGRARSRVSVEAGIERVARLREVWPMGSTEVTAVLRAPVHNAFDGREVWDTLTALGLHWGDGDLFVWNSGPWKGLFYVSTTTPPGYFMPEQLVNGELRPRDLLFQFLVADSPAPTAVLEALIAAAAYAKERLGGELVGHDGAPFDADADRAGIAEMTSLLSAAGIATGSVAARNLW